MAAFVTFVSLLLFALDVRFLLLRALIGLRSCTAWLMSFFSVMRDTSVPGPGTRRQVDSDGSAFRASMVHLTILHDITAIPRP